MTGYIYGHQTEILLCITTSMILSVEILVQITACLDIDVCISYVTVVVGFSAQEKMLIS